LNLAVLVVVKLVEFVGIKTSGSGETYTV